MITEKSNISIIWETYEDKISNDKCKKIIRDCATKYGVDPKQIKLIIKTKKRIFKTPKPFKP